MRLPFFANTSIEVSDPLVPARRYRLPAATARERKRAKKMGSKEPGTIRWLHQELRVDDVFWDVGANMGIYSVFAAARIPQGRVIAFEPHGPTFHALTDTIALNALTDRITPLSVALDQEEGYLPFHYQDRIAGSTGSQLGSSPRAGTVTGGEVIELKHAVSGDYLIQAGVVPPPTLLKIDVDGNEPNIIKGLTRLLTGPHRPRQLQVEVDPEHRVVVPELLATCHYNEVQRHRSRNGDRFVANGGDPGAWPVNIIFAAQTVASW